MKLTVLNHLSLDGVMQGPGGPDEDTRGGFNLGGWAASDNDEVMGRFLAEHMASDQGALLFGRRSYEHLLGYWNGVSDSPFTAALNNRTKYVATTRLEAPLPWPNSLMLGPNVVGDIAQLKAQTDEGRLLVMGSGVLVRSLMPHDLIDEYVLMIHPLVLGSGTRMFPDDGMPHWFHVIDSVVTTTGVMIVTYRPGRGSAGPD